MLILRANLDDLELVTSTAADIEVHSSAMLASSDTPPIVQNLPNLGPRASITSIATTQIIDTSGFTAGYHLNVKHLNVRNNHGSTACVCTVQVNDGTDVTTLYTATLLAGEAMVLNQGGTWLHYDANGGVYPAAFNVLNMQDFAVSGTYTPTPGMKWCIGIATGSGGGGGGSDSAGGGSADVGVAGGGGAGETRIGFFSAAQIGVSQSVTVGAAGTAGSATAGTAGGNGNDAMLGALLDATGGLGGGGSGNTTQDSQTVAGGAGGTGGTGGTLALPGGAGGRGIGGSADGTIDLTFALGGLGGQSFWGGGAGQAGAVSNTLTTVANVAGSTGTVRGAGGGGAVTTASSVGAAGGAGGPGGVFIIEFV